MTNHSNVESKKLNRVVDLVHQTIAKLLQLRIVRAALRYSEHRGPNLADSVTYRALFSVFAAVLLGFSLAALWLGDNPEAMTALITALDRVVPGITDIIDTSTIAAPTAFTVVGVSALIGLVGAAISAIGSLRVALRVLADEAHEDGFFVWVLLRNLLVAIAFGGLLALAAALSALSSVGVEMVSSWFGMGDTRVTESLTRIVGVVTVIAIDTTAIAIIFRVLSGVKAPARALWVGAALGGLGLTVLQELSGLFVRGATSNPLLASFAALIALLIWFNLSAQVILIASSYILVTIAESKDLVRERYGAKSLAQHRRLCAEDLFRVAKQELVAAQIAEKKESQARSTAAL